MPWCPNCKTEYREGITHCADCKVELVAEYKDAVLNNATAALVRVDEENRTFAQKLHDFLEYSGIPSTILEEDGLIGVYVTPEDEKKAKKCFKAFYSVESELVMQKAEEAAFLKGEEFDYFGDDEEDEDAEESKASSASEKVSAATARKTGVSEDKDAKKYVSAASRYDDYRSSGFTFVILGVLGIIFAVLNFMDVITLFGSTFSSVVLFVMFGIFLALGIFSFVKASQLKAGADAENKTVEEAKQWMAQNFTKDMLNITSSEESDDEIKSEELLYMDRLDQLVARLLATFPSLNDSLAEQLIDEFFGQFED